jgi:hypothetical protein
MCIEDRIEELENKTKQLTDKVQYLETVNQDKWVSAKELSEIMGCSLNNIYIKIRKGEIYATNKLGSMPRIPMSQFYKNTTVIRNVTEINNRPISMKEKVFGVG